MKAIQNCTPASAPAVAPPFHEQFLVTRGAPMIQALDIWLPAWRRREKHFQHALGVRHVMIAVCDYFGHEGASGPEETRRRLQRWQTEFPRLRADFRDADGAAPKHTFFVPAEHYDAQIADTLAALNQETECETEIQLHHENDTADNLRRTLRQATERLSGHGLLARDESDAVRYGFMHGHGTLDNSHPHGRHCGVSNELAVLRETGCYADFTLPTAPERTQTRMINSVYYARGTSQPKSHDQGRRVLASREPTTTPADELLIVQGPLTLNPHRKQFGFFPSIENGILSAAHPPTPERLRLWLDCRIAVEGRPNWLFIKLNVHGATDENTAMLLGEPMRAFHRNLVKVAERDHTLRFHYVTAREMVNIIHAAESGHSGEPGRFRDYRFRRAEMTANTGG